MSATVGYCTNVHAGPTLRETWDNLRTYALPVKEQVCPNDPMGVGLWLANEAARELLATNKTAEFASWLADNGLTPFTFNGFPYGNFHQPVVKHRVYEPTWWDAHRLDYTLRLIEIQHALLPAGAEGTISTLPIAWGTPRPSRDLLARAAEQLRTAAQAMRRLRDETGRQISVCIEPEPGCFMQRSDDIAAFFRDWLLPGGDEEVVREHLRICHDVCHAAVMFEEQADVLRRFESEGIKVGKVQVSAAVKVDFDKLDASSRQAAFAQLSGFREERYLHQTCIRLPDGSTTFHEDLPQALASCKPEDVRGEWRTHFHVPIYLDRFGLLHASQQEIRDCLAMIRRDDRCRHFEVETYAWGVLPAELQVPRLADGIAKEMNWFHGLNDPCL